MLLTAVSVSIEPDRVTHALETAIQKLPNAEENLVLDFSSVGRIDASALGAMEKLAAMADKGAVKVVLHGVKIDIYRVLKLVNLTSRFVFTIELNPPGKSGLGFTGNAGRLGFSDCFILHVVGFIASFGPSFRQTDAQPSLGLFEGCPPPPFWPDRLRRLLA